MIAPSAPADPWLDRVFGEGRTFSHWQERDVRAEDLRRAYEFARLGPTSANCQPLRILFLKSAAAKARLEPALAAGNRAQTKAAPVTAIFAMDLDFPEALPRLFGNGDAKSWFAGNPPLIAETAFRNSSLQAAYFLIACRALGLDCGPMSGFDRDRVDAIFFAGTSWRANFLMNIGYGDPAKLRARDPRLDFVEACRLE